MKTINVLSLIAALTLSSGLIGCGLDNGEEAPMTHDDGGDGGTVNPPTPPAPPAKVRDLVAPFKTDGKCNFNFAIRYVSGATTGEMVLHNKAFGNVDPANSGSGVWFIGLADDNRDGYYGAQWTGKHPVGYVTMSYRGDQGSKDTNTDAHYGYDGDLDTMQGLEWVHCNWVKDGASNEPIFLASGAMCELAMNISDDCSVTPAGNMAGFDAATFAINVLAAKK